MSPRGSVSPHPGGRARAVAATLSTLLALGCGSGSARPPAEAPPRRVEADRAPEEVLRFFPLEAGMVYSYETQDDAGGRGMLVVQIEVPRPNRAELRVGSRVERLDLDPLGVAYAEGGYLLRQPLSLGSTWRSKAGSVRVDGVDVAVSVPYGDLRGCVRTVEESALRGAARRVASTYCPDVGLVLLDVEATSDAGHQHELVKLKTYAPRVDLGADGVTHSGE